MWKPWPSLLFSVTSYSMGDPLSLQIITLWTLMRFYDPTCRKLDYNVSHLALSRTEKITFQNVGPLNLWRPCSVHTFSGPTLISLNSLKSKVMSSSVVSTKDHGDIAVWSRTRGSTARSTPSWTKRTRRLRRQRRRLCNATAMTSRMTCLRTERRRHPQREQRASSCWRPGTPQRCRASSKSSRFTITYYVFFV